MLDNQLPEKSCFISSHVLSPPPWGLVLDGCGYQAKTKMAGDRNNHQKWYSFVIAELKSTGNVGNNEISVILAWYLDVVMYRYSKGRWSKCRTVGSEVSRHPVLILDSCITTVEVLILDSCIGTVQVLMVDSCFATEQLLILGSCINCYSTGTNPRLVYSKSTVRYWSYTHILLEYRHWSS